MNGRMLIQIRLAFTALYIATFNKFVIELFKLPPQFTSIMIGIVDVIWIYLWMFVVDYKNDFTTKRYLLFLVLISSFTFALHEYSFVEHINGFREIANIVFVFSFIKSAYSTGYAEQIDKAFRKYTMVFLVAQIPIAYGQYFIHSAGDYVGGGFGLGGSGKLTICLFLLIYYLTDQYKRSHNGRINPYYFIFFAPIIVNETKISFILLPIFFLSIVGISKIRSVILPAIFGGLSFLAMFYLYSNQGQKLDNPVEQIFNADYITNYLLADAPVEGDVPRLTKVNIGFSILNNAEEQLFGKEYGAFKGSTIGRSSFSERYDWLLSGSRPYFFYLFMTGGWVLVVSVVLFFASVMFGRGKDFNQDRLPWFLLVMFFVFFLYDDGLRDSCMMFIFFYLIMYMKNRNHLLPVTPKNQQKFARNFNVASA